MLSLLSVMCLGVYFLFLSPFVFAFMQVMLHLYSSQMHTTLIIDCI